MKRYKVKPEIELKIKLMKADGHSQLKIAKELNLGRATIQRTLSSNKHVPRDGSRIKKCNRTKVAEGFFNPDDRVNWLM
jgi:DNA invertase Pin-like site-specific DNA recombinase